MIPFLRAGLRKIRLATLFALSMLVSACSEDKNTANNASPSVPPQSSGGPYAVTAQTTSVDHFFMDTKPQPAATEPRPEPRGDLTFTIDFVGARNKVVRVRGWGFRIMPPHQPGDRVTILLVGPSATYAVLADVEMRPDVTKVLNRPGMDDTGFISVIDAAGVEPGEYSLFLRIGGSDGEATEDTNQKVNL